jgi:hypothetical protein
MARGVLLFSNQKVVKRMGKLDISDQAVAILKQRGWTEDRKVDISNEIYRLAQSKWKIYPKIQEILESIQGLDFFGSNRVKETRRNFDFFCLDGEDIYDDLEEWRTNNHINLFPLGGFEGRYMLLDENGSIYISDVRNFIVKLGENFRESLDNLIFKGPRIDMMSWDLESSLRE